MTLNNNKNSFISSSFRRQRKNKENEQSSSSQRRRLKQQQNKNASPCSSGASNRSNRQHILWSCVARDDVILAEAGDDIYGGNISDTAKQLLARNKTAGFEFHTQKRENPAKKLVGKLNNGSRKSPPPPPTYNQFNEPQNYEYPRLKGIKFHLYDRVHRENDDDKADGVDDTGEYIDLVWVFAAVYDPSLLQQVQVQSFLEKLVVITEVQRETDSNWVFGSTLSCQASFAPVLLQRMEEVTYLGKMAMLEDKLETSKALMQRNIEMILEREERLEDMVEHSTRLNEMASVFKNNSKRVRRMKMMQNAKHGVMLGTAITAGVAIVVVPPLVALL